MSKSSILYLTFEHPNSAGGGLATYLKNSVRMHLENCSSCSILHIDPHLPSGETSENIIDGATIISWNPRNNQAFSDMGYWTAVSHAFAEKVAELVKSGMKIGHIEACDGFGLAYHILQRKLAKDSPFTDIHVSVTLHTPIGLIDKWSGRQNFKLPDYWVSQMEKFCILAADSVTCPSDFLAKKIKEDWGVTRDDIISIRNPYFTPKTPRLKNPEGQYLIASRVQHFKGVPEAIAGFDLYWNQGGASVLAIAGKDTYSETHGTSLTEFLKKKYAKRIEEGKLIFLGLLDQGALEEARNESRALIHPSLKENFPYTVIEHMARGGLVAASRNGGQAEIIISGKNGFLFDPLDPHSIATTIHQLDKLVPDEATAIQEQAVSTITKECDPTQIFLARQKLFKAPPKNRDIYPFIEGNSCQIEMAPTEEKGLISVVIPYFNLPDLLPETVESALASEGVNFEIIIVNDGSTDPRALPVAEKLAAQDSRIRIINKENTGVADTRNVGAKSARGEFIALLDADDLISPSYYSECLRILNTYRNVGYVGCWNEDFNEEGRIRVWPTFNPEPSTQILFNTTNCQGLVVRRQAYLNFGQHDPNLKMFLDDWESTISMMENDVRGVMIQKPLFHYRIRGGSIFRSKQGLWHTNYEYIVKKHSRLATHYAANAILFLNQNGPNTYYHNPSFASSLGWSPPAGRVSKYKSPARQALSDLARAIKSTYRK